MFNRTRITVGILTAGLCTFGSHAHVPSTTRAITHAPIGVMGDHMHKQGEMMISYRMMNMEMSGNIQGTPSNHSLMLLCAQPDYLAMLYIQGYI